MICYISYTIYGQYESYYMIWSVTVCDILYVHCTLIMWHYADCSNKSWLQMKFTFVRCQWIFNYWIDKINEILEIVIHLFSKFNSRAWLSWIHLVLWLLKMAHTVDTVIWLLRFWFSEIEQLNGSFFTKN